MNDTAAKELTPGMTHEEFYLEMTTRNTGIITDAEQEQIKNATVLVAGCGSIGGAVVEPLVRMGVQRFILAEPDEFDVSNLNRQAAFLHDVDVNKAEAIMNTVKKINPYVEITLEKGITEENVDRVTKEASIIFDGVDVTTKKPLLFKYLLHKHAQKHRTAVISGYDMAGAQLLINYDYRDPSTSILHGALNDKNIAEAEPFSFLYKIIPKRFLPIDLIQITRKFAEGTLGGFPQVVYCADLYGVLGSRRIVEIFNNEPVKRYTYVDVHQVSKPLTSQVANFFKKWIAMVQLFIFLKRKGAA